MYNLLNTETNSFVKKKVNLNQKEVNLINYAYALNGVNLKYVKFTTENEENEVNLFKYTHPV